MIKNVVFDIGNVLAQFGWEPFFAKFGISPEELERVAKATVYSPLWDEIDRGVLSEDEILEGFIKNDPEMEDWMRKIYADFSGLLRQYEYAKDWIWDLQSRGYRVFCLSNMSHKAKRECPDSMDFLPMLDGYVLSCDVNLIKPEKEIFDVLFERYALIPSECVFIDDLQRNINAAKKIGMEGIVFEGYEQAKTKLDELLRDRG